MLALVLAGGMTTAAAAQDVPEATPEDGVPAGLEQWYARSFSADLFAMLDPATPEAEPSGWFLLSANVLKFESEEQAAAGVDELLAQLEEELAAEDIEMDDVELDVDLDYTAKSASVEEDGITTVVVEAVAQDGEYVYAVIGITLGADAVPLTEQAVQAMAEGDASGDESFSADGTSEGGLWAKLPTAEAIQAEEPTLTTVEDAVFYPVPELGATPAS